MSWQSLGYVAPKRVGNAHGKALYLTIASECNSVGVTFVGPKVLIKTSELPRSSYYDQMKLLRERRLVYVIERRRPNGIKTSSFIVIPHDLKGAYDYFEQLVIDGQIDSNPMTPEGGFRQAEPSDTRTLLDPEVSDPRTQDSPSLGLKCPTLGQGVSDPRTEVSDPRTQPSRVNEQLGTREGDSSEISLPNDERERPEIDSICDRLLGHVRSFDPSARPGDAWRSTASALLDERSVDDAIALIDWAATDDFWSSRVVSPSSLQRNWSTLLADRSRKTPSSGTTKRRDRLEALEANAGDCSIAEGAPPSPAETEWSAIAEQLREVVGENQFEMNLRHAHAHSGGDGELLIAVPEPVYGWVRDRFAPPIDRIAGRHVEIVVCQEATP